MTGHFGKVCKRVQKQGQQKQPPRRVNLVAEEKQQKSDDDDSSDEQYVLGVDRSVSPPFLIKGRINCKKFCLMRVSGFPVNIISRDELQRILQYEVLFFRPLTEDEKYVDDKKQPVNLLGYIFCELEVGGKYIRKARILVARPGARSIVEGDWLNYLQYAIEPKTEGELNNSINIINNETHKPIKSGTWK